MPPPDRPQSLRSSEFADAFDDDFVARLHGLRIKAHRSIAAGGRGERQSRAMGSGVEFADRRPYAPGDDIRRLDWGLMARSDQAQIKLYREDRALTLRILIDTSSSMLSSHASKLRHAFRLAAALAHVGASGHDRVRLMTGSHRRLHNLPAQSGRGRLSVMLDFLRDAPIGGATKLDELARRIVTEHPRRGLVIVLSDFYDPAGAFAGLSRLRVARNDVICMQVVDEAECEPDPRLLAGRVALVDVEHPADAPIDIDAAHALCSAYAAAHREYCGQLSAQCRGHGIRYARCSTSMSVEHSVFDYLRRMGIVQ